MAGDHHFRTVPVLLVGAGPAGLVGAVTLARHGVGSLLVERNPGLSPLPRATGVSVRTMELLRSFGLEERSAPGRWRSSRPAPGPPRPSPPRKGSCSPAASRPAGRSPPSARRCWPPCPRTTWSRCCWPTCGRTPPPEVRFATELAGFDQDAEGVTATLRDVRSGASTVVRALPGRQRRRPQRRPDRERLEDYTEARLTGLLRAATGVPDLRPRILAMGAFSFAAQVAERYRAGNAFLVGDAAHRMTPRAPWA
jgi:2-polyprenyl-6-methoxyphenol hydroxylase-like FAD-dependent oxidoreductase